MNSPAWTSPADIGPPRIRFARSDDASAAAQLEAENLGPDAWPFGLVAQGVAGEVPTTQWWVAQDSSDHGSPDQDGADQDGADRYGADRYGADQDGAARGELCGHAVVSVVAEIAELQRISVTPAQRRTGLATALLAAVATYSATHGAERLLLEVRVDNEAARAFYAARGFVELARRARYYTDGAEAVVMELKLIRPTGNPAGAR